MEITRENAREVFRRFRDKYGKTFEEISKKSGVAISTLNRLENLEEGKTPRVSTVSALNQYLKSFPDEQ